MVSEVSVFSPFDIIIVSQVMSLLLLLSIVEHHHRGIEIDNFSSGQEVEVGPAVTSTVAISGQCLH